MKLFSTLIAFVLRIGSVQTQAQAIWDDFDNPENISYFFFDGIDFDQEFSNPAVGPENTSALCAKYDRNPGVIFDVIVMDPLGGSTAEDLSDYISGNKQMSVKIYSPEAGITVQITLEDNVAAGPMNYPVGRHSEYTAVTTVANAWETLEFGFVGQPDATVSNTGVNRLVLLFEPGEFSGNIFYYDDLMGPEFDNPCEGVAIDESIGEDYECQRNVTYDFSNGQLAVLSNPLQAGVNESSTCAQFTKFIPPTNDGAFGGELSFPFSSATYSTAGIDLYSPDAPQNFIVIFQDAFNNDIAQSDIVTSSSSAWVTYEVDLGLIPSSTSIAKYVLLLDPATDTEDSIYLDNFRFASGPIGVDEQAFDAALTVYPVPVANDFSINSGEGIEQVVVCDLTGKEIARIAGNSEKNMLINSSDWANGIYIVSIEGVTGAQTKRKLSK
jgi:hypothetical protein